MSVVHRVPCDHADKPHTLYYGIEDGGPPVPCESRFDNQQDGLDAIEAAWPINSSARENLWMLKLFPTESGEAYTCYQWSPPPRPAVQPDETERLEPDGGGGPFAYEGFWTGLCGTIVVTTLCLLVLHWAGLL